MGTIWPDGKRCAAVFTFDLDAEYVFLGTNPAVANMPRVLTQGNYVWRSGIVNRILDMLDQYSITSTWYVVAMNAVNHPDVVKEIADRGHDIATHIGLVHGVHSHNVPGGGDTVLVKHVKNPVDYA